MLLYFEIVHFALYVSYGSTPVREYTISSKVRKFHVFLLKSNGNSSGIVALVNPRSIRVSCK